MNNTDTKIELSNYWDDFQIRVNETIDCLGKGCLPSLQRLTVHLTKACNFRCTYCNGSLSEGTMKEATAQKIVDEFSGMGGSIIHFTGGEPTIVSYFEDICAYAKSKGLQVSSNTNAFKRVDVTNIDKLKASFDTADKIQFNKMVGTDAFDKVVDNLTYYSEAMGTKMLSVTAVLNKNTYRGMLDLSQFAHRHFKLYNLYYSNYKGDNPDMAFEEWQIDEMFERYIPVVLAYFRITDNQYSHKQLKLYHKYDFVNSPVRFEDNKVIPCTIQLSEMSIDVNGKCHNCSHLFRDGVLPKVDVNVTDMSLNDCFVVLKKKLEGDYVYISDKCLSGCNCNLIGFNKAVSKGEKI